MEIVRRLYGENNWWEFAFLFLVMLRVFLIILSSSVKMGAQMSVFIHGHLEFIFKWYNPQNFNQSCVNGNNTVCHMTIIPEMSIKLYELNQHCL